MTEIMEMTAKLAVMQKEVDDLVAADKFSDAEAKMKDVKTLMKLIEDQKEIDSKEKEEIKAKAPAILKKESKDSKDEAVNKFLAGLRSGVKNAMTEGTDAEGGYIVPEDISTEINEFLEAEASLRDLVDVETVTTMSGARTYKSRASMTGFSLVAEGGKIGVGATPQFERILYAIKKYAGTMPVTNELMKDTDQNLRAFIIKWLVEEGVATDNRLILEAIATKSAVDLADLDGIKNALNVTLGAAFKGTSTIVTNDDGIQYLDTLKDENKRYQLNPNPTDPAKMQLRAGASVVPIFQVPNAILTTTENKVPFIIGDLKEGIKLFDRELLTILPSDVAVVGTLNAYENDLTLFRAIKREDVVVKDAAAFVNGYITVTGN